jgi:hypothetical protein
MKLLRALGAGLGMLVAVLGGLAWALGALSSIAGEPPHGMDLGGDMPPERTPESAPGSPGEDRARSRYREQLARLEAGISVPRTPRLRLPRLHLPRIGVFGGLVAWARRRLWTRKRIVVVALVAVGLGLAGGVIAYLAAGSTDGSYAQFAAGSVNQVTGLAFDTGGIPTTANPTVPIKWNPTKLSDNTTAVQGYIVNRRDGSNVLQSTGAACNGTVSGTSCAESSVPDGTWTYKVQGKYYNWLGPESTALTVKVDTSAPSITAKPSSPSANPAPSFSFSHATYSSFKCRVDGAATFTTCTSPDGLSGLANGSHTFRVEAVDANGFATQVASYTWTIDTTAPTITANPASTSANTSPSFSFTHGSYSSFQCRVDNAGGFVSCTSPDALSGLSAGSHTFRVRAVDADGVVTSMATYSWTINTSAPTFTSTPASTSGNPNPSFSFTHSAASYTFMCKLDGGSFASCSSPKALSGLSDGSHTFTVEAIDPDGVVVPTTASYTWTINTTAPSITSKPQTPSANKTPSFGFTHTVGSYTFKCKVDTGAFATCTSPNSTASLADGSHTFTVEAVDTAGFALTNTASYTWTVNTTAPSFTSKPQTPSANTAPSFSFNHGVYTSFQCKLDTAPTFTACTSPKALSALSNASHTFQVVGIDADGVATTAASYTWTVDASAPTISAKPSNPSANASPSFTFSHTQASYTLKCQLDGSGFAVCPTPKAYSGLADGSHTFQVEGVDADGVTTSVASATWLIDSSAPNITAKPTNPSANASPSFTFSHTQATYTFQCKLDGGSFASCTSPKAYSGLADGPHTFQVLAVATDGSTTTAASYPWSIDTTAPTASFTSPVNGTTYKASTYNAGCAPTGICGTAADATGVQTVKVSIRQGSGNYWNGTTFGSASELFITTTLAAPGATSTGWNYPFALPADGSYTIHVQATDTLGNAQTGTTYAATSVFTIDTTAPTVSASVIAKTAGGTPGFIKQGGTYFIYANVTDASGVSSVTADVSTVTTGATTVTLTAGSFSVGGVSYGYRSGSQTADASLSAGSKAYTISATDTPGNGGTVSGFNVTVDNTGPTAVDIQANTGNGMVDSGDVITYTFSEPIDPNSILSGWNGTSTTVTVSFNDAGSNDNFTVTGTSLGTVAMGGNYQKSTQTASATMVLSGSTITVTLTSSPSNGQENTVTSSTMVWTPSASATDRAGNAMSTATATQSGAPKKNF